MTTAIERDNMLDETFLDDVHEKRIDRNTFTIFVGGDPTWEDYDAHDREPGVEYRMADRFDINLHVLSSINPNRPILIKAASCGGDWEEGMQMFGAILDCPNPVTWMGLKVARSMTSIIPLAADKFVLRVPTKYMIHHGELAYEGHAGPEYMTDYEETRAMQRMMLDIYVQRLSEQGMHKDKGRGRIHDILIDKMCCKVDFWLTAHAAVEWGFVDSVFGGAYSTLRAKEVNRERRIEMYNAIVS